MQATREILRFKGHVEEGHLIPEAGVALPEGTFWVTLQRSVEAPIDAIDAIIAMAEPIGPSDMARNFDIYVGRVIDDGTGE